MILAMPTKRSMGHGYAGIDNELYTNPKTGMFFSDAKAGLAEITAASRPWCPADTGTQGLKPLSPRRGSRNDPDQHSTRGGPDGAARDRSR